MVGRRHKCDDENEENKKKGTMLLSNEEEKVASGPKDIEWKQI